MKAYLGFLKYALAYRKRWFAVIFLGAIGSLLGLVNPYLTKLVVDNAIGGRDFKTFIILSVIGGSLFIFGGLISSLERFLERYIRLRINFDLNRDVFRHIRSFPFKWFQDKSTGEHIYKLSYDVERVTDLVTTIPPQAVSIFPRLIIILGIVFYLNWKMAVFSMCLAPILYLPSYYFSRRMRSVWKKLIENSQGIFTGMGEIFSHIQLIKSFGMESSAARTYLKRLIANMRLGAKNIGLEVTGGFVLSVVGKSLIGFMTFYGGYQVINGEMSLGTLTAIMVYVGQLMALQNQIAMFFQTSSLGLVSCGRISKILNEKSRIAEATNAKNPDFKSSDIVFENISFGYREDMHVLRNLSFNIESGRHIALVGPSGCGKTTILNLLLRLYDPWQGNIHVGGANINALKIRALRERIGIVLQEPFLWNDSVINNIRYGRDDATRGEIEDVARITGVDDIADNLPSGYDSVIGENACKISEGQKQRIAIARALIRRPRILILDEAFSSLDSESEKEILSAIKDFCKGATIISVSHRLSSLAMTESVYYLKRPEEMIKNRFEELLKNNDDFGRIFSGQS